MLHRPRFKAHYQVETVAGYGLALLSEHATSLLQGSQYEIVAPCLDGRRSVDEIVELLSGQISPAQVHDALLELEKQGHLEENSDGMPAGEAALWASQGIASSVAARRLNEVKVTVHACGDLAAEPFVAALESLHVQVGAAGQLGVVVTDDYLRFELQDYNRQALQDDRSWMLVKPTGSEIWFGPVFRPGTTGCWECLAQRLRANRAMEIALHAKKGRTEPFPLSRVCTPATQQIAWNLAASEVAAWIAKGESANLEGQVLTLDVRSWKVQTHTLVCLPSCPACGVPFEPGEQLALPLMLRSRKKTFTQDGGHRIVSPEATLDRFGHHVSPITGAVSRLARDGIVHDGVMHAYSAGYNSAFTIRSLADLGKNPRQSCAGKGASDAQAKVSALCEALERFSGIFRGDEPCRKARRNDLGEAGIHPNACMRFSDQQYRNRDATNALAVFGCFVPTPFDEDVEIDWTPVWSLTRKEHRYLPTAYCYYDYPVGDKERSAVVCCSNGAAAGNTLEEAIVQGFLELVERDSVALWWYNRLRRPAVDLDSFDEPYLIKLRNYLQQHHRDLRVLDLTSDLAVPTFVALSRYTDRQPEQIMLGFGTHLDARIGVLRAVTELNQFLVWQMHNPGGPSLTPVARSDGAVDYGEWLRTATLANQPYLVPDPKQPLRRGSDYPQSWGDDLKEDVLTCQALVERHGMEMLVLDQTRPDIGLPVVKVFVPGLRHFRPRFAPGRLYDVPLKSGWMAQPLAEDQLNPIPMFT